MKRSWLIALLFASACADEVVVQDGLTGVELTVANDEALDQLSITGAFADGAEAFEPALVPEAAGSIAPGEHSVVLLLAEDLGGQVVTVRVDGLKDDAIVATERTEVTIVAKQLATARVALGAPAVCGDGVVRTGFELCDDGGTSPGDGCGADCATEDGWTCAGSPSICARCGDGAVDGDEQCDDMNLEVLDGCAMDCTVEHGWTCNGMPSTCTSSCGDSLIAMGAEDCDDGDGMDGDGCSSVCVVEPGYTCTGEPSVCTCDNDLDNDGIIDCDDTCIDVDGDMYGEPGGGGDTCLGRDCDDTVATCTEDCATDVDTDSIADCADTCLDADADMYGIDGPAGTCLGPDCDDAIATCNTDCTTDVDVDLEIDCVDTCIDADGDMYGVAGGGGNTCVDVDCDDAIATCTTDCTTDADLDLTIDCNDVCIDADGDMYGVDGPVGTCLGADCDDTIATCTNDCTTDADSDLTIDCIDTCIDADGDMFGVAGGGGNTCTAIDCDDTVGTCTTDCTTNVDADQIVDCADTCLDGDGDGYGAAGGAGNTCTAADCDDTVGTCTTDCTTNVDTDAIVDCADTCLDGDGDGYGAAGGAGNTCIAADCDDGEATCNVDCVADVDADTTIDCLDTCLDGDGDGFGTAGGAGNTCTAADCDDTIGTCTVDCVTDVDGDATPDCGDGCLDADGDGYGDPGGAPSTCTAADCDDTRLACTTDCVACLPGFLNLTGQTPVALCGVSALTIDLDGYDGAAGEISCTAPATRIFGLTQFETGREEFNDTSSNLVVTVESWPNNFPTPSCSSGTTGDFLRFNRFAASWARLGTPLDVSGLANMTLRMIVGYRGSPNANERLSVSACCGAGCTPAQLAAFGNDDGSGTDECTTRTVALPAILNDCNSLMIQFDWPNSGGRAGIDDIEIEGEIQFTPIAPGAVAGQYTTSISSCRPATFAPMCTWNDPPATPRSGSTSVTFQ